MTGQTIIDLSLTNQAKYQNYQHLFHQDVYRKLSQEVQAQLTRNKDSNVHKESNINHVRIHHAILLNGKRGAGKTSVLVNLKGFIEQDETFKKIADDILFLDPVDPTLLDGHEDFLNIVVGQINKNVDLQSKLASSSTTEKESYYQRLDELASALEGEQNAQQQFGLDRMLSYQGGLGIGQLSHQYFQEVLRITKKYLIVLTVDDVDMSLCHGFNVLEVVRKHVCSPSVMPIVSGDLQLYRELVGNEFAQQLVAHQRAEKDKQAQRNLAQKLAEEYLRKVFPIHLRFNIPAIEVYFSQKLGTEVQVKQGDTILGNLYAIQQFLLVTLNGRVNGEEKSSVNYIPCTARELMQWLSTVQAFLDSVSKAKGGEKLLNSNASPNILKHENIRWWLRQPRIAVKQQLNAQAFYQQLASYFDNLQRPNLRELCLALKIFNEDNAFFNLNDITYLNPIRQLNLADDISEHHPNETRNLSNENHKLYAEDSRFDTQKDRLPPALQKADAPLVSALPALEPIHKEINFSRKYFRFFINNVLTDEPDAVKQQYLFLLRLFSYDDYYTSNQSTPLVFFGRFFELITTSLIRDIDKNWLKQLLARPPYYSIISISTTKTFDDVEQIEDDENSQLSELNDDFDVFLNDLANDINLFRKENLTGTIFTDVALLAALQSKYFNQLNLYKLEVPFKILSELKKHNDWQLPLLMDIALRSAYSYWGALGSFEKSSLFFDEIISEKIAHQNFFAVNALAIPYPDNKNAVYRDNILPFKKINTKPEIKAFTTLLNIHPVFQCILNLGNEVIDTVNGIKSKSAFEDGVHKVTSQKTAQKTDPYICRDIIRKILGSFLKEEQVNAAIEQHDISGVVKKLHDFYKMIDKYPVKQLGTDQLIDQARLGGSFKSRSFNRHFSGEHSLNYMLRLIWDVLLDADSSYTKSKPAFITQLINRGVNEKLAILLASGIDE